MASVEKGSYTVKFPEGVEYKLFKRDGERWASFTYKGTVYEGKITKDRKKILVKTKVYYVRYVDHKGVKRSQKAFTSKKLSEELARKIEEREEKLKAGKPVEEVDRKRNDEITIGSLLDGYTNHLTGKLVSRTHLKIVQYTLNRIVVSLDWSSLASIDSDSLRQWLVSLINSNGKDKITHSTANHYVRAAKAWGKWISRQYQISPRPFEFLEGFNDQLGIVRTRRVLSEEDFVKLIESTKKQPRIGRDKLTGLQRSYLYQIAAMTGYRASELSCLTRSHFHFDEEVPFVLIPPERSKNRKLCPVPLSDRLIASCREWIESHKPDAWLFPGKWAANRHGSTFLKRDMKSAGLPFQTAEGRYDFHSLRTQFLTDLIKQNLSPAMVQKLGRLSSIDLLTKHYTKIGLKDMKDAMDGKTKGG